VKILTVPSKILYREAVPVDTIDKEIQGIIDRMFIVMYRHKGIGLAAPQIGISLQIVVINIKWLATVLINPVIHKMGNAWTPLDESCLSIPNFTASIKRATQVSLKSFNRHGLKQDFEANGLLARVIQHEVDHLHGVLINEK
jgi:peptide deformylase